SPKDKPAPDPKLLRRKTDPGSKSADVAENLTRRQFEQSLQGQKGPPPAQALPKFTVTERPISKDYRSFAANVFNTVAFKMVEWLTPNALETLTQRAAKLQDSGTTREQTAPPTPTPAQKQPP